MMNKIFTQDKINTTKKLIQSANSIVILAHKSPDGDSIGSSTALLKYLRNKGLNASICHPDPAPEFIKWLWGTDEIITFQEEEERVNEKLIEADLIFCLDFNVLSRLGKEMADIVEKSNAEKVLIDHHLFPSDEFDVSFSDTNSCSTAQLIFEFICALGDQKIIDIDTGESIYCGIMTDTGSFRFPSTNAQTHRIIAELLEIGVKGHLVHEKVYDTNSIERIKLRAYTLNNKLDVLDSIDTVIISLTEDELHRFDFQQGDTEGLVNVGLSIKGINKSIFLKETNGLVKMSFRSKGEDNPVNAFAQKYFEGGGHANASGGVYKGSMEDALEKLKTSLIKEYA